MPNQNVVHISTQLSLNPGEQGLELNYRAEAVIVRVTLDGKTTVLVDACVFENTAHALLLKPVESVREDPGAMRSEICF